MHKYYLSRGMQWWLVPSLVTSWAKERKSCRACQVERTLIQAHINWGSTKTSLRCEQASWEHNIYTGDHIKGRHEITWVIAIHYAWNLQMWFFQSNHPNITTPRNISHGPRDFSTARKNLQEVTVLRCVKLHEWDPNQYIWTIKSSWVNSLTLQKHKKNHNFQTKDQWYEGFECSMSPARWAE